MFSMCVISSSGDIIQESLPIITQIGHGEQLHFLPPREILDSLLHNNYQLNHVLLLPIEGAPLEQLRTFDSEIL